MKVCSVCQRCYEDSVLSCSEENHAPLIEGRAGNCELIANYRLEFLHETSASGESYRAVDTILKKTYLVKILAPEAFDEKSKKQFFRDAQSLSEIIHPNIARVFEFGTAADGSLYAVTEFFTTQTLRECLKNVGAPSEVTALTIARQAAEGLEALHAVGVLHRSVKPENIILTTDAENRFLVKLQNIDFGGIHQKTVQSNAAQNLTDLRYFSPEQCAAKETDAQTDIYALGVVLFEMLDGKVPFDAPYADALITKQINEPPPSVKVKNFDIRMLLTQSLTDALQKTMRLRLKSASAFTRRLRHIEQLATHSPTPPPAISYPAKMDKSAIIFTPPAKMESASEVEKTAEKTIVSEAEVVAGTQNFTAEIESPAPVFPDLTTNKLPPIDSIIQDDFRSEKENSEIHKTNEPALIEWEQPDDIPSITQALGKKRKEIADAAFASEANFATDDEDSETSAPFGSILGINSEMRREFDAKHSAFSYEDAEKSWNLPDKRKILTGAGVTALIILAVGGTLLSRQFQLARDTRQTTVQSTPNGKILPKSAEAEKVSESDKSSTAKSENVQINNPSSESESAQPPILPDFQPREINEKTVAPIAQIRSKKRAVKDTSENRVKPSENDVSSEVFDKKGETKSSPNKKTTVKNQASTSAKNDIFTRPRIVKNP